MKLSLSTRNFEVKPKEELKDLTYSTTEITPIELFDKVINGYCFQNHYNFEGVHQFKGKGVKVNNYVGSYVVSIDIDHQKKTMRETLSKIDTLPTFAYETFSNKENDYCYRFCYCFKDEIIGKQAYAEAYKNICIKNNIETLFDKRSADCYHYMNGTTPKADSIYFGNVYDICGFVSVNTLADCNVQGTLDNNISGNETFNKELVEDIKKIGYANVVKKYANTYRHFECSTLPKVDNETPLIDLKGFYEICRIWQKGKDGKSHIKRLCNGEHRRFRIFYNLCIRRLICNDLSLDELLYAGCWEMAYYVNNTDKKDRITLGQLMTIALNAYNWNLKDFNYIAPRKQMVNYKYCKKHNVSKKKVASMLGNAKKHEIKENKKEIFFKFYNDNLTIDENIEYFFEKTGLTISQRTAKRWKSEENKARKYAIREKSHKTLKPVCIGDNINGFGTLDEESVGTLKPITVGDNINGFGTLDENDTKINAQINLEKLLKEVEKETLQALKSNDVDNYTTEGKKEAHKAILGQNTGYLFNEYIKICIND